MKRLIYFTFVSLFGFLIILSTEGEFFGCRYPFMKEYVIDLSLSSKSWKLFHSSHTWRNDSICLKDLSPHRWILPLSGCLYFRSQINYVGIGLKSNKREKVPWQDIYSWKIYPRSTSLCTSYSFFFLSSHSWFFQ